MSCVDPPIHLDDDSLALQIQLEEVQGQREHQSGKWVEGNPPDYAIAFEIFENEVNEAIALVQDMRLAHSIAMAVDSDALAIELLTAEEASIAQDRQYALSLDEDGGATRRDNTNISDVLNPSTEVIDWDFVFESATPYLHHQQAALQGLPNIKVECSVCGDNVPSGVSVRLGCEDTYCKPCLKEFFLRVIKDETLFPPSCHHQAIDLSIIEPDLSVDELNMYKEAEAEFTSTDRVYCAAPECAKYIPAIQRSPDYASCGACGAETCMYCKALAHEGPCPDDEARQSLLKFGKRQGWQSCSRCGQMVHRYEGCDHTTCGVEWKHCPCGDWEPELLNQRAQQVVDREAQWPLAPAVRHRAADTVVKFVMIAITSLSSHANDAIYWHAKTAGVIGFRT
ncbi:unnamed protein product [Clonostachys chloroleuca]|uniref:IBR domain-containing protein n=1 Tax=Clonostachys chloroleuca TaxID=1926264 RepID=A0AA35PZG6_9HYPO|nr:unnamed protein product [Clonostachys chloroleuca]